MDQQSFIPSVQSTKEPLSPKRGDAPGRMRRRRSSVGSGDAAEKRKSKTSKKAVKHVSPVSSSSEAQAVPRAMYGSLAAEHRANGSVLYRLTGQLLIGCYLFVGFHGLLLQFYPEVYTQLRHPPSFGHPLMLLPPQGSILGWFFSFINGSIQQFVMRGVLGCLIFICLLHLVRVVLYPIASSEERFVGADQTGEGRRTAERQKRAGLIRRFIRTAWSAQQRLHRRRERLCACLVGVVCLGLSLVQVSSFFFGGWTLKAIGFPDIYVAALTKPGGLWGHETAADVFSKYAGLRDFSQEEVKSAFALLGDKRNNTLLLFILVCGFALDAWGQYLQTLIEKLPNSPVGRQMQHLQQTFCHSRIRDKVKAIRRYLSKSTLLSAVLLFAGVLSFASYNLTGAPSCNSNDHHWVDYGKEQRLGNLRGPDSAFLEANPPLMYSEYLSMRDGIRLAADVYLPYSFEDAARSWAQLQHRQHVIQKAEEEAKHRLQFTSRDEGGRTHALLIKLLAGLEKVQERLGEEEKQLREQVEGIPVYLEITRYNRRSEHFWPFTLLSIWRHPRGSSVNIWSWQTQQMLSANNYAVVVVDTRGSGASFGSRSVDLGEEELKDSAELVEWSKSQWFSNGKVAGGGLSYDGMLGLSMAAGGGVDAAISLFTPIDVMGELVAPGGAICHSFLNDYSGLTNDFEHHGSPWRHMVRNPLQFPLHVLLGFIFSFGGTSGVLGHEAELPHAIRSHRPNWKMTEAVSSIRFYDDKVQFNEHLQASATSFGITKRIMQKLAEKQVSLLMVSGFCDSATARGAIRLFSFMQEHAPESKPQLILGNWNHGGRRTCDPYGGNFSCFENDLYASVLRFFDCRLKNKCWGGIEDEPPVHFWQTGSSEWRTAESFPPKAGMKPLDLTLTNQRVSSAPLEWNGPPSPQATTALTAGHKVSGRPAIGGRWVPPLSEPLPSSFEHTFHDITQRVQLYWNMIELHEEARVSSELTEKCEEQIRLVPGFKAANRHKRTWLSRLLSALVAAISSSGHSSAGSDLREIFSLDENAYFMQLRESDAVEQKPISLKNSETEAAEDEQTIDYTVEYLSTSGEYSRWTIAQHPFRLSVNYGNRLFQRKKRPQFTLTLSPSSLESSEPMSFSPFEMELLQARPLSFVTEPLTEELEMIGSAFLHLTVFVEGCNEVSVFAYLEDLDVNSGFSHYVTEGQVVASNRPSALMNEVPVGAYGRLTRSFFRHDSKPVNEQGEHVMVSLSFEPNAWTFQEGHAIRLVLTGSDIDNFSLSPTSDVVLPRQWKVITSSAFLSLPTATHPHD